MKEIIFIAGSSIEMCYAKLKKEADISGEIVFGMFNGNIMRSDETLDDFYLKYYNKTKSEVMEEERQWHEEYLRREAEHKEAIPRLIVEYRNKARGIIPDDRLAEWDKIVPIRLDDMYHGIELQCALDIISILNKSEDITARISEAKTLFYTQGHSGMSGSLLLKILDCFHPDGKNLAVAIDNRYPQNYIEIEII